MSFTKHSFFDKAVSYVMAATFVVSGATVIGTASTPTVNAASTSASASTAATPSTFSWDNATVYFLLTDRFNNGDKSNDNAYGRQDANVGDQRATFHGGDFAGITQKINEGYFNNLGVNAIWLTAPYEQIHGYIQGGSNFYHYSYHGYYVLDYTETDAAYGSKEEFKTLVDTAHEHGIRIIMDVVMNHAGYCSMFDMDQYGFGSLADGWKTFYQNPSANAEEYQSYMQYTSNPELWAKWWGPDWIRSDVAGYSLGEGGSAYTQSLSGLPDFKTEQSSTVGLPQILQTKWSMEGTLAAKQAKYGTSNTVNGYITTWLSEWVREYGIDGFRCDTAKHVEMASWKKLKDACTAALKEWKANNPTKKLDDLDFWMTGEHWEHGVYKDDYYTSGAFDSMINFDGTGGGILATGTVGQKYTDYANAINNDDSFNVLTYISSHDSTLARGDMYYLGSAFLMLPGAVQIYYGDETNRPLVPGISFDGYGREGHSLRSDMNWSSIDEGVLAHWQKVGQFRNNHVAVGGGANVTLTATDGVAFGRTYSKNGVEDKIAGVIGASENKDVTVNVSDIWADGTILENAYDQSVAAVSGGKVTFNSGAHGTILIQEPDGSRGRVNVIHIDKDTNETIKTETLVGLIDDSYTASPLDLLGYSVSKVDGSKTGKFSETEKTVKFYYEFDSTNYARIKVQYVDATTGAELAESDTTVGKIGTTYAVSPKTIKNYEADETLTTNSVGTVKKGTTTVVFKYNYVEPTNLRVHYYNSNSWTSVNMYSYDESGATVLQFNGKWPGAAMTAEGNGWFVGEAEDTESALVIFNNGAGVQEPSGGTAAKGYDLTGEAWVKDGKVYPTGKVNVKYVGNDGKILATETLKGMADGTNSYTTSAKTFDGYTLESTPANATGKYTEDTITVVYTYSGGQIIDDLVLSASLSASTVNVGSSVTASASATGGTGTYKYAFYYQKSGSSSWTTVKDFSTTKSAAIKPTSEGTYSVCIKVKDSSGTIAKKYITLTAKSELTLTAKLSATSIVSGNSVTASASAAGGSGSYKYAFFYKKSTQSAWTTAKSYSTTKSVAIKPAGTGTYNVCIKVKDTNGTEVKKYIDFKSTAALTLTAKLSAESIVSGNSVTASASATGGSGSYKFAFLYKKSTQSAWTTAKSYSTTKSVAIKPAGTGTYNVCIKVKDTDGTEVKKYIDFKSTEALSLKTASLSATRVTVGGSVTAKAAATGGSGSYKYGFYYKKSTDSSWVTAKDFSTTASVDIKPAKAATYNVCIKVKDSSGTIAKKYVDFTAKSGTLTNNSTLSADSVKLGNSIKINGAAVGGTGSYKYAYYYKKVTDSSWTKKSDYSSSTSVSITPTKATVYDVVVYVKDTNDKVAKKYLSFAVNATATSLKNNSSVSSASVSKGTKITIKGSASGITDMAMYKYEYKLSTDSTYKTIADYSTSTSKTWTPTAAGTYDVRVTIQDMLPSLAVKTITVVVK